MSRLSTTATLRLAAAANIAAASYWDCKAALCLAVAVAATSAVAASEELQSSDAGAKQILQGLHISTLRLRWHADYQLQKLHSKPQTTTALRTHCKVVWATQCVQEASCETCPGALCCYLST